MTFTEENQFLVPPNRLVQCSKQGVLLGKIALAFPGSILQSAGPMRLTIIHGSVQLTAAILSDETPPPAEPMSEDDKKILRLLQPHRPPNRSICEQGVRPCPYVSCRYNLYLDVRGDGVLRINFPNLEPDEMIASCALDMSEDGPRTLDQVASLMGMSKERARQLESAAFEKLRRSLDSKKHDDLEEGF